MMSRADVAAEMGRYPKRKDEQPQPKNPPTQEPCIPHVPNNWAMRRKGVDQRLFPLVGSSPDGAVPAPAEPAIVSSDFHSSRSPTLSAGVIFSSGGTSALASRSESEIRVRAQSTDSALGRGGSFLDCRRGGTGARRGSEDGLRWRECARCVRVGLVSASNCEHLRWPSSVAGPGESVLPATSSHHHQGRRGDRLDPY